MKNQFFKYHGLGNSYIVIDENKVDFDIDASFIRKICSPAFGIGSDGLLLKVNALYADYGVRIFNPDGSEAEKSGNGLRIFGKYVFDNLKPGHNFFSVETLVGNVTIGILEEDGNGASQLRVEMGKAIFKSSQIPVMVHQEEIMGYPLKVGGRIFNIHCANTGNPHCVIFQDELDESLVREYGPLIENHRIFPVRTNVQFAKILDKNNVELMIWERGAGYTMASGSSACAVSAVGKKLGLLDGNVTVLMPGGQLEIDISEDWSIGLTGPVEKICEGILA
jgi:diaminopimelate epimerase